MRVLKSLKCHIDGSSFLLTFIFCTLAAVISSAEEIRRRESVPPNFAISPLAAKQLALVEEKLVSTLNKMLDENLVSKECHDKLSKYIEKYNQDREPVQGKTGLERGEAIVENGLLTFRMIQRFVTNLLNATAENGCHAVNKTVEEAFSNTNMTIPSVLDLEEALRGILRIQFIYGFNATSQLRFGILGKTDTRVLLDFDNCLSLGQKAISMNASSLAYQWLTAAAQLAHSLHQEKDLNSAWFQLMTTSNSTSLEELKRKFEGKTQITMEDFYHYNYTHYATCREEIVKVHFPQGDLFCFYHDSWHPYMILAPIKTEVLAFDPVVLQFHQIFVPSEVEFLGNSVEDDVVRTGVEPAEGKNYSVSFGNFVTSIDFRLNYSLYGPETPEILRKLNRKIEMATGLLVQKRFSSQTQIMLYGALGGHYTIHFDSLIGSAANLTTTGDRIATFFINLSDVKMGGYTAFPRLGVYSKPERGSATIWFNVKRNGDPDYRTLHTGCPVVLGGKHVVRRGIFQLENMWNYRCSLDKDL